MIVRSWANRLRRGAIINAAVTGVRCALFPVSLVAGRLASRIERVSLVGLGVATGAAMLAAVLGGSLTAQERSVTRALEGLAPAERAVRVAWFAVPRQGGDYRSLDAVARRALAPLASEEPIRVIQHRQTRVAGKLMDLGAVDGLGKWVTLTSGRLPRPCHATRCEVLQLGGKGGIPNVPGLRLVRVGHGVLKSTVPFGRLAPPGALVETVGARFASQSDPPPFLVAEGVDELSRAPELESVYRSYAWTWPIEPGSIAPWQITGYAARVARARSALKTGSHLFDLTAPVEELQEAEESARVAGRRLLLIGGQAAALLLAFAILAAANMRRDAEAARRRISWFGGSRWQTMLLLTSEAAALTLGATAVGWAAGVGISAAVADYAGAPAGAVLLHSVLSGPGIALAIGLAGAAALILLLALSMRPLRFGALSVSLLDVAALGALAAVALALVRGDADPRSLAGAEGTATLLILLPGLAAFIGGVLVARGLAPAFRLLERLARRAPAAARLAALSLARSPGQAAIAVTFLVVSLGLALFAAAYRSTLDRGQADQAAFAVPLDFILREDLRKLVTPVEAAPLSRYRELGPDIEAAPVLRASGSVSRLATTGGGVTLLGLPADTLADLDGWRADFASSSPSELARRIEPGGDVELRGPRLPPDATTLLLPVSVHGDDVTLNASVLTPRGDFALVEFGDTQGARRHVLRGRLPADGRRGRIVALSIGLTTLSRETGEPLDGVLALGPLEAEGPTGRSTVAAKYRDWIGVNGIDVTAAGAATRLRYFVTNQVNSLFRPRQATDRRSLPAIVSPRLAAAAGPGGVLPVQLFGQQLSARVVATARRFPSIEGDFVVADQRLLATAFNADSPKFSIFNEVWIGVPGSPAAQVEEVLGEPPFDVLRLQSRHALEAELRSDPLAQGALLTLIASAATALVLALAGLLLTVIGDVRDERGELFDLEAQGAGPETLRRHLRLRAAFAGVLGLAGGIGLGIVLVTLVVSLVTVTAGARTAEPPLLLEVGWPVVLLALAAYVALAVALIASVTWGAFRAPAPSRAWQVSA